MRYPVFRTRHVGSATPGAVVESHQSQFWNSQPPVGRIESQKATQILRAGNVLPTPRGNPRKWGPGKGDYEHEVLIRSRPRRRFGDFAAVGKVTRRPQAAKLPCAQQTQSETCPLIRHGFAVPPIPIPSGLRPFPLDKGDRKAGQRRGGKIPRTLHLLWLKPPQSGFNKEGSTHETNPMRKRRNLQT